MEDGAIIGYLLAVGVGVLVSYALTRWFFSIDKQLKQKETIITILTLMAQKQGIDYDEILKRTNPLAYKMKKKKQAQSASN